MSQIRWFRLSRVALILGIFAALVFVMGGLPGGVAAAPTCTTECYVSPGGDDANAGTSASPLLTIQAAINQVTAGGTVHIAAGTYAENVVVNKWLALTGAGSGSDPLSNTIIDPLAGFGIELRASGVSATARLVIKDLRVTGAPVDGIRVNSGGGSFTTIDNVASVANIGSGSDGLEFQHSEAELAQDFQILNSDLSNNTNTGLRFATFPQMDGLTVTNTNLNGNSIGFSVYTKDTKPIFNNIAFTNVSIANNLSYGSFVERASNAVFDGLTVTNNNNSGTVANGYGFLFYLRYDVFDNVAVINSTFANNASGTCCTDLSLGRANSGTLTNLTISHNTFSGGSPYGIYVPAAGYDAATTHINRNSFTGTNSMGAVYVAGVQATPFDAMCNWWGAANGPSGAGTGSGATVTANVNFNPWLMSSNLDGPCGAEVKLTSTDQIVCDGGASLNVDFSNVVGLYGYEFKVNYPPAIVSATGAFVNTWFNTGGAIKPPGWQGNCNAGTCQFAASLQNPTPAKDGGGTVATVNFTTLGGLGGTFTPTITDIILTDRNGFPIAFDASAAPEFAACGVTTISGKVSLQGRTSPGDTKGVIKLVNTDDGLPAVNGTFGVDGTFNIPGVPVLPDGSAYKIQATHILYVGNEKAAQVLMPGVPLTGQNTTLLGGDANNGGLNPPLDIPPGTHPNNPVDTGVNITDITCIGGAFGGGIAPCGGLPDSSTDINADTQTNIQDLSIAGGNFDVHPFQPW